MPEKNRRPADVDCFVPRLSLRWRRVQERSRRAGVQLDRLLRRRERRDGETGTKSVIVDVLDDGLKEGDETILLTLTNATGGAIICSPKDATVTLLDDE